MTKNASSGYDTQNTSSGDNANNIITGENSVCAAIGVNSSISAIKGTWITLAEYRNNKCILVKSAIIDGEILKENVFYRLENGDFTIIL